MGNRNRTIRRPTVHCQYAAALLYMCIPFTHLQGYDVTMTQALSSAELYQRLETLETRLAYQEHWLDTLDHAVAQQERRLEKLEHISALMRERLRDQHQNLSSSDSTATPRLKDDVPPHY